MALTGQVHEVDLVELAAFSIQEMDVVALCNDLVPAGNALGLLHTAVAHDLIVEALLDARRSNYKNVGFLAAPAVHGLALLDQALHARTNAGGVCVKALFHIVGAQHDDEQVDDFMALEQGIGHAQSIHGLVDGVCKNGGAAGKALFGYQILVAQSSLQAAGPALVLVEADAAVGIVLGVGTITVGVGIAQAENMCFHLNTLL